MLHLSNLDVVAISIALVSLMALVITSAVANARLTRERNQWRDDALWWNAIADENREIINSLSPLQRTRDLVEQADFHEHITGKENA